MSHCLLTLQSSNCTGILGILSHSSCLNSSAYRLSCQFYSTGFTENGRDKIVTLYHVNVNLLVQRKINKDDFSGEMVLQLSKETSARLFKLVVHIIYICLTTLGTFVIGNLQWFHFFSLITAISMFCNHEIAKVLRELSGFTHHFSCNTLVTSYLFK